jgi:hypothetical protein
LAQEYRFDFTQFNTEAAHLDLMINASHEDVLAGFEPPDPVARPIVAMAGANRTCDGDEALLGAWDVLPVARSGLRPAAQQLTCLAPTERLAVVIRDEHPQPIERTTDRHNAIVSESA